MPKPATNRTVNWAVGRSSERATCWPKPSLGQKEWSSDGWGQFRELPQRLQSLVQHDDANQRDQGQSNHYVVPV